MTAAEYLKELNKAFKDFKFYDEDHHYEYKGQRVGISVTRLIEEYTNEFDAETIAEKVAIRDGKTIQDVLDEWKYKNEWSCEKGSLCHEFAQFLWNDKTMKPKYMSEKFSTKENIDKVQKIFDQAESFYNTYEDKLEHIADEYVIGSEEYDIASAVDHLFINRLTGELVLVDYKTNSDIHKNEKYAKSMKVPLHNLKDTTINHYYIQLSIYKYIIEKYTNLKVSEMFIVYMSENIENYEIIDVPYLEKEIIKILENRRM